MTTKKVTVIISGLLTVALFIWDYVGNYRICDYLITNGSLGNCPFDLTNIGDNLIPIIPFFFFSFITYFIREQVFKAWLYFALPWIVLSMVLIYITPEYSGGGFGPQIVVGKGTVAFLMSALFVVISILVIFVTRIVIGRKQTAGLRR